MQEGELEVIYGDHQFDISGAWFWAAYPGPRIRFHTSRGRTWNHRYVAFQGAITTAWLHQGLLPQYPQAAPPRHNYSRRFDELIQLSQSHAPWSQRRAVNLLEGLLLELAQARSQATIHESWLENLLQRLQDEKYFSWDYDQLARDYGMALSTLRRRFRDATGSALHAYVMEVRISRARILLGETDLPLKAISSELGYGDIGYFSRQFREVTGVTPSMYRKSRQNGT
jgi:AraC-like DNA-binding protein